MIRAVCFDLFHTLVDVGQIPGTPGRYTADILGLDREQWNAACFSDAHDICQPTDHREVVRALAHSLDDSVPLALIHQAADERKARFDYTLNNIDPDVLTMLSTLQERGLRLALVSNASTAEVAAWPDSPLAEFFDAAMFSCHCGVAKPEAGIYQQALAALNVTATESLYIGDGGSNEHVGASEVGLHTVLVTRWVKHRLSQSALQQRRDYCRSEITCLAELPDLVDSLSGSH